MRNGTGFTSKMEFCMVKEEAEFIREYETCSGYVK